MFKLCKNLGFLVITKPSFPSFNSLQNPSILYSRNFTSIIESTKSKRKQIVSDFTVSYLVDKCGLYPESALSISKVVQFKTPTKPDSVLKFLKNHEFSETQIRNMIKKFPRLLVANPEQTLLPKFEFFVSKGFSEEDTVKIVTSYPWILMSSVENRLVPCFDFFSDILQSNDRAIKAIRGYPGILSMTLETRLRPIIRILRDHGVSDENICSLIRLHPRKLISSLERFREIVEQAKAMGFDPSKSQFVFAIAVLKSMNRRTWEKKLDVYRRWGLSETDVLAGFAKWPACMQASEDKIMAVMDLFVNKLGWKPLFVMLRPHLLIYSLEKRLIPRASVLQFLMEKELVSKDFRNTSIFMVSEKQFLEKFVNKHAEASQMLKLYSKLKTGQKKSKGGAGKQ